MSYSDQAERQTACREIERATAEMEPGLWVMGHRVSAFGSGRVGSRVSVSDPMLDPVLSFNMSVYRGVVFTE